MKEVQSYIKVSNITEDDLISEMILKDFEPTRYILNFDRFIECQKTRKFSENEGTAKLIYINNVVTNSRILCFSPHVIIGNNYIIPYDSLYEMFKDKIKVLWIPRKM